LVVVWASKELQILRYAQDDNAAMRSLI